MPEQNTLLVGRDTNGVPRTLECTAEGVLLTKAELVGETGTVVPTDITTGALIVVDHAVTAAINGDTACGFVNEITPGAALIVLTNAGLFYNLGAGEIVMITQFCMELTTLNDNVRYEIGYTAAPNGGGAFSALSPARYVRTGNAWGSSFLGMTTDVYPPARVRYSDGARSITMRVNCNDAAAVITPAWHGYIIQT